MPSRILQIYKKALTEPLSPADEGWLRQVIEESPYFALPYYIQARQSQDPHRLFVASTYSPNRNLLKNYMEGVVSLGVFEWEELKTQRETFEEYINGDNHLFAIVNFDANRHLDKEHAVSERRFSLHQPHANLSEVDIFLDTELKIRIATFSHLAKSIREELALFASKHYQDYNGGIMPVKQRKEMDDMKEDISFVQQEPNSEGADSQNVSTNDLIDRFLTQLPLLKKRKLTPEMLENNVPDIDDEIQEDEEMVTETIAKLHIRQGRIEDAVRIYQKLILLFPEKSAYFEAQIKTITK